MIRDCLCRLCPASVTEEEIFVNTTVFPMFLSFSSDISESADLDGITHDERLVPQLQVRCVPFLQKLFIVSDAQLLRFHSQGNVF